MHYENLEIYLVADAQVKQILADPKHVKQLLWQTFYKKNKLVYNFVKF